MLFSVVKYIVSMRATQPCYLHHVTAVTSRRTTQWRQWWRHRQHLDVGYSDDCGVDDDGDDARLRSKTRLRTQKLSAISSLKMSVKLLPTSPSQVLPLFLSRLASKWLDALIQGNITLWVSFLLVAFSAPRYQHNIFAPTRCGVVTSAWKRRLAADLATRRDNSIISLRTSW